MTKQDFIERAAIELCATRGLPAHDAWAKAVELAGARPADAGTWPAKRTTESEGAPGGAVDTRKRRQVDLPTNLPNYGRSKGVPIASADDEALNYYAKNAERSIADPDKARFRDREAALLEAIRKEQRRREESPEPPEIPAGSAPSDDDIAF